MIDLGTGSLENKLERLAQMVGAAPKASVPVSFDFNVVQNSYTNSDLVRFMTPQLPEKGANADMLSLFRHDAANNGYHLDLSGRFKKLLAEAGGTRGVYWAKLEYHATTNCRIHNATLSGNVHRASMRLKMFDNNGSVVGGDYSGGANKAARMSGTSVEFDAGCVAFNLESDLLHASHVSTWELGVDLAGHYSDVIGSVHFANVKLQLTGYLTLVADGVTEVS